MKKDRRSERDRYRERESFKSWSISETNLKAQISFSAAYFLHKKQQKNIMW